VRGDINMNEAAAFHKTAEGYHMNEVQPSQTGPVVLAVEDAASGAVSSGVTPDGIVTVTALLSPKGARPETARSIIRVHPEGGIPGAGPCPACLHSGGRSCYNEGGVFRDAFREFYE